MKNILKILAAGAGLLISQYSMSSNMEGIYYCISQNVVSVGPEGVTEYASEKLTIKIKMSEGITIRKDDGVWLMSFKDPILNDENNWVYSQEGVYHLFTLRNQKFVFNSTGDVEDGLLIRTGTCEKW